MSGVEIGLVSSAIFLLLLFGYWQWRKKYRQSIMNLNSSFQKQGSWWYRSRYTSTLPPACPHSGKRVQPKVFATEHPITSGSSQTLDEAFPYKRREKFFSATEHALLRTLEQLLRPYPYRIFSKVSLTEILDLSTEKLSVHEQQAALERLRRKHLDFVICHHESAAIIGVILLDEESEQNPLGTHLHQRFVDIALSAAGIPTIHVPAKDSSILTLQQTLQESLQLPPLVSTAQIANTIGICPKCGKPLKRVKVTKGKLAGKQLRACSNYPHCKTLLPEQSNMDSR
jgi:hypothetical protein